MALRMGKILVASEAVGKFFSKEFGDLVPKVQKGTQYGLKHTDNLTVVFPLSCHTLPDRTLVSFLEIKQRACCLC